MKNENSVMAILAAVGALCSYAAALVVPLAVLLAVMVGDYVSGMAKAWSTGKLCSKTGLRGILKKLGYLALGGPVPGFLQKLLGRLKDTVEKKAEGESDADHRDNV